ncbi:hypothetical protein [Hymenobacter negativus]|uniref:Uncharacterized protein n=1 Tax=Hymenobacter negativus TaxID=2795026 RepID=A0ABS3QA01_9BACT|nr:hypothetical protein [Hymenobacter negativus]MBO2008070.1 hypothetical protein [Hymenobacter negativus]
MTVTRLKRKHRKNIARANNKQHIIKELLRTPVLKNVDIEELKSRFTTTGATTAAAPAAKAETKTAAKAETKTAANAEAFDDAEAVTKPVNEDGQEGEHPKPEIAL